MELLSLPDVSSQDPLAVLPKNPTAPMQTPMINANMTAYSTAVGPLSSLTKREKPMHTANSYVFPRWQSLGRSGRPGLISMQPQRHASTRSPQQT